MTDSGAMHRMGPRMWLTALMIAVLAALAEGFGDWADFAAAGARNLLVAGAVVLLTGGIRSTAPGSPVPDTPASPDTDRRPAGPGADGVAEMIRREVGELNTLADHLYAMTDLARHECEVSEETFVRLDDLRWLLGNYVIKGGASGA